MKIAARYGNTDHAPGNSRAALISAYTGGADVLWFGVSPTQDGVWVLAGDADISAATGQAGRIPDLTLEQLREFDFSERFAPPDSEGFYYYDPARPARRLRILTLEDALEDLPRAADWLIELRSGASAAQLKALGETIRSRGVSANAIMLGDDQSVARVAQAAPGVRRAAAAASFTGAACDVVVGALDDIVRNKALTTLGKRLTDACADGVVKEGLLIDAGPAAPSTDLQLWLGQQSWAWALGAQSTFGAPRDGYVHTKDTFKADAVDRTRFALGYAKANRYARVFTDAAGVNIDISAYDGPLPSRGGATVADRVERLEWRLVNAEMDWPFYSGGGVGVLRGVHGDFAAEITYEVVNVGQATTLEMAVVNVDPGAHRGEPPASFRDKDSFYDPHGAPPFVGVEHDEDDGFRINWNLGTQYDNNQYGPPVGDGRAPRGARMRLERRGAYFSAYYCDPKGTDGRSLPPSAWVCVGVARNDSMNPTVFLRCVGKRWRQERADDPSQYEPILPNRFTFHDLKIECFP